MNALDISISDLPFLLNDFFRHRHKERPLRVFLCGSQAKDAPFDLRIQIKRLVERRMGCKAFLGEDIEELRGSVKATKDHLTIEVSEAKRSDLIIIFLESPGTISELTAFALDRSINPKLVVFNDEHFRDAKSFLNLGPLKLIADDKIVYYNPRQDKLFSATVSEIDRIIAMQWYARDPQPQVAGNVLAFDYYTALAVLYAAYPLRYSEMRRYFPKSHRVLDQSLRFLFDKKLITSKENKYVPTKPIEDAILPPNAVLDICRVRTILLNKRLRETDLVADYRLLI